MSIDSKDSVNLIEVEIQEFKSNVEAYVLADTNCGSVEDLDDDNIHNSEDAVTSKANEVANNPELAKAIDTLNAAGLSSIANDLKELSKSSLKFKFIMSTMYS